MLTLCASLCACLWALACAWRRTAGCEHALPFLARSKVNQRVTDFGTLPPPAPSYSRCRDALDRVDGCCRDHRHLVGRGRLGRCLRLDHRVRPAASEPAASCTRLLTSHHAHSNDKLQVGLPLSIYTDADAKSSLCGTKAYATNPATGASVTVTVVDGSDRDAFTTFSKSAYLALGGDADVGMLPIKLSLSKEANSAVLAAAAAVVDDDKTSSTKDSSSSSKAVVAASSSSEDAESSVAATSAPAKTTAAPVASTTVAPTSSFDSESAAAAAAASSKASAKAYQSEQAAILAASQASAAAESSQAAAAGASARSCFSNAGRLRLTYLIRSQPLRRRLLPRPLLRLRPLLLPLVCSSSHDSDVRKSAH